MRFVRVQYDGYNRRFQLLDREWAHDLEDGETYLLIGDTSVPLLCQSADAEELEATCYDPEAMAAEDHIKDSRVH